MCVCVCIRERRTDRERHSSADGWKEQPRTRTERCEQRSTEDETKRNEIKRKEKKNRFSGLTND